MPDSPGPFTTHTIPPRQCSEPGRVIFHSGIWRARVLHHLGQIWKNSEVVRPQPGQGQSTIGVNARRPMVCSSSCATHHFLGARRAGRA